MRLDTIQPAVGATTSKKRLGRGTGSGLGKTSGKGHKGQWARSGGGVRPGFEGGQMPLTRRVPKRGFNNHFKKEYVIVNLDVLNACFKDGDTVTLEILQEMKLVSSKEKKLKILSNGTLTKALTVEADFFSAHAAENICAAGGKAIQK